LLYLTVFEACTSAREVLPVDAKCKAGCSGSGHEVAPNDYLEMRHPPNRFCFRRSHFREASDWPLEAEGHLPGRGGGPRALRTPNACTALCVWRRPEGFIKLQMLAQQRIAYFCPPRRRHPERSASRFLRGAQSKDPEGLDLTQEVGTFSCTNVQARALEVEKGRRI
jgi:hypothetical protein